MSGFSIHSVFVVELVMMVSWSDNTKLSCFVLGLFWQNYLGLEEEQIIFMINDKEKNTFQSLLY